jgi:hypothetical protein
MKRLALAFLLPVLAVGAGIGISDRSGDTPDAEAADPLAIRALAPDIVNYIVDGDQGPNSAVPGVGLINPEDGLNVLEVLLPGDQSSSLGGNMDFYPDYGETALLELFGASDTPPGGPPQMNITAGLQTTPGLDGKLAIVAHLGRAATHGGTTFPGEAETGTVTFGTSVPGYVYWEALLATAAPHGQGPVDPTFASVTCGSWFSYLLGSDPFTMEGKADFADGDCDGVIHGPMDYDAPQDAIGSCIVNYLVGPLIPNDPTCREDSLIITHLAVASSSTALGLATATFTQEPAPFADLAGIGAPTTGGTGSRTFELMDDPVGFVAIQNPDCNAGALPSCVPDAMTTGNAGPQDCQPQPAMDMGSGAAVLQWDQIDNTDLTLALATYAPVTAGGRYAVRHRLTWDSDNDNIVHPQGNFSVTINVPIALPYPIAGVLAPMLLCSGSTPGTANITVASNPLTGFGSTTFPVTVEDAVSLRLDMDATNGNGVCDPIDSTKVASVGPAAMKVGVCLSNPLGTLPVAAFGYNITYNDTIVLAPEVADVAPSLDDNPDANVGVTVFTSTLYPNDLGGGWDCSGGVGAYPVGDNNPATGSGNGNAYSGGCGSGGGPNILLEGPLGVITFNALQLGIDTLGISGATVTADDFSEIGSCNPAVDMEMACVGGTVIVASCIDAVNSDPEVRPNGPALEGDDGTWPNHDMPGDLCDTDDDNDGLTDAEETTGASCGSVITLPNDLDSDNDHLLDGWECTNGSNPLDATSRALGTSMGDSDGDNVPDLWERRGYNTSMSGNDTDGDGCSDWVEIASVDENRAVTDADRLAIARRSLNIPPFNVVGYEQDFVFDIDHNGVVGDPDRLFVARAALLGPPWEPKSCP